VERHGLLAERDDVYMKFNTPQGKLTAGTDLARPTPLAILLELGFGWTIGTRR
jgi:hypothetical protein